LLAPLGVLPALVGAGGPAYLAASVMLGAAFLGLAAEVFVKRKGPAADRAARRMFGFSILYLFLLFAVLFAEQVGRHWL
jgi:protoheme IX farnesyltransferase